MTTEYFSAVEEQQDKLRSVLENLGARVRELGDEQLVARFATLSGALALGTARAVRHCPSCHAVAFAEATLCLSCWKPLKK